MFTRKYREAHADYDKAIAKAKEIESFSKYCSFHHSKGLTYQYQGDFESAKEYFKWARQIDPGHIPSIFHYGLMQHKLGELPSALESFSIVIESKKDKESIQERISYESRGLVYFDMKNYTKALEDFDRAVTLHKDYPECYYFRGLTKNHLGLYAEAIDDFNEALALNSENKGGIHNGLGYSYKLLNDFDKALNVASSLPSTSTRQSRKTGRTTSFCCSEVSSSWCKRDTKTPSAT